MYKKLVVYSRQLARTIKRTANCSLITVNSQTGMAQMAVLLLLVAGVVATTYVVQQRTNLIPHAQEESGCDGESQKPDECRDDGYVYHIYQDCNGDYRRDKTDEKCGGAEKADSDKEYCLSQGWTWKDDHCLTGSASSCDYAQNQMSMIVRMVKDAGTIFTKTTPPHVNGSQRIHAFIAIKMIPANQQPILVVIIRAGHLLQGPIKVPLAAHTIKAIVEMELNHIKMGTLG